MGDRSQVCIKKRDSRVYLYSHWGGEDVYAQAAKAMKRAPWRLHDAEYLARCIFCDMVRDDMDETTGFGIGTYIHGDVEHPVPVLDCGTQIVSWEFGGFHDYLPSEKAVYPEMTFAEFITKYSA